MCNNNKKMYYPEYDVIDTFVDFIENNIPFSFSKYGDGEWICANRDVFNGKYGNTNSDYDTYTENLQRGLTEGLKDIVNHEGNNYIGAWETKTVMDYWLSIVENKEKILWADYHTFIFNKLDEPDIITRRLKLYKSIQNCTRKKIIICNQLLQKSRDLLRADEMIIVPFQNWFDQHFNDVLQKIIQAIGENEEPMVFTSCGMGAKVLISTLRQKYPKGIFIDMGSALDYICTMRNTRGRKFSYNDLYEIMKPILPENWHDPKYNGIYEYAKRYLIEC